MNLVFSTRTHILLSLVVFGVVVTGVVCVALIWTGRMQPPSLTKIMSGPPPLESDLQNVDDVVAYWRAELARHPIDLVTAEFAKQY